MRIFIDTNVLVSASLDSTGVPRQAFTKATTLPNWGIVCDLNLSELRGTFIRKFPHKMYLLSKFLAFALPVLEIVRTPATALGEEARIRDVKDRPILRAAIMAGADMILTGDRDFLESGIARPLIVTPAQFVRG